MKNAFAFQLSRARASVHIAQYFLEIARERMADLTPLSPKDRREIRLHVKRRTGQLAWVRNKEKHLIRETWRTYDGPEESEDS